MLMVALLVNYQARQLSAKQSLVFHDALLEVRKAELVSYTKLARSALSDVYAGENSSEDVQRERAKQMLTALAYSDDGYFYAYKLDGENVVHPKQPYRIGHNWWNLSDDEGQLIIQNLISQAKQGGGYTEYLWEQPSLGQVGKKLGYAEMLEDWGWMFGTGIYIDDIDNKVAEINSIFDHQIRSTSQAIIGIAAFAVAIVFGSGLLLWLKERNLASSRLQLLTKRVMDTQSIQVLEKALIFSVSFTR
jgi:two-component system NarL family sensor kinase